MQPGFRARPLSSAVAATLFAVASATTSAQGTALEEVIVTAQKREQNLQDVPLSVGTLTEENLQVAVSAGADVLALGARIPSLYVESSNGRLIPRFYIRGLGNSDFDINASQPVSMVYDDVVLENPAAKGMPLFDIESVEVLRGPQGSLFGRNTTAGIVKFDSRRPTAENDGYFAASYGRYDQRTIEGALGGTLIDGVLMARASVFYNGMNDWIDNEAPGFQQNNVYGGFEDIAARLQFLWTPNEKFSALVNFHGRDLSDGTPTVFRANVIQPGTRSLVDGFERDEVFQDSASFQTQEQTQYGVTATLDYDFGRVTATSITGYHTVDDNISRGDVDGGFGGIFAGVFPTGPGPGIPFDAQTADGLAEHKQWTQELRLASNDWDRLNWQVGFYYFYEDIEIDTYNYDSLFNVGAINGITRQFQETESWALFGTVSYDITDRLNVQLGLRYSDDQKDFTAERLLSPIGFGPAGPFSVNPTDENITGDISATYMVNDNVNVYARFARGHRAPSVQGRILFQDGVTVADTEINHSFEAGVKSELMDGRLRLNVTGYYYEIDDQQLTKVGGAFNFNELVNADKTIGWGFETDAQFKPNDRWLITAGLSYNNTEIDDPNLTINGCGAPLNNCTVTDPVAANGEFIIDGNSLYHAPEWIANWVVRYGHPFAGGELFVLTDWAYRSNLRFFLYDSVEFQDNKLLEGGVRAGYITGDGNYQLSVFGRNITNDESAIGAIDFNNLTAYVNNPPMWGVEFRMGF